MLEKSTWGHVKFPKPVKREKQHKYRATQTQVGGEHFPSKLEAAVFQLHKSLERGGAIFNLKRQATVTLKEKCQECGAGAVRWKVDFSYETKSGKTVYVEAKGSEGPDYRKRKKLWMKNPPARLEIYKGTWKSPRLVEVIE